MTKRRVLLGGGAALVVAIVAAGAGFWYVFLRDDSPPPVSLGGAVSALTSPTPAATPAAGGTTTATATATVAGSPAATATTEPGGTTIDGTWVVDTSLGSFAGYRIGEQLASIGTATAVGRTRGVEGEVVIEGGAVTSARVVADMTRLQSDSGARDNRLRTQGIETARFPTATFELTAPITLPAAAAAGTPFATTLTGNLTLHGVTRLVSIPAEAQLVGSNFVVVGSLEIALADYNIAKPTAASVLSIDDSGDLELQLYLSKR
jgi:polyisoprenoid-binding protein YceI